MKAPKDATIITVSNAEEHKFLEGLFQKLKLVREQFPLL